MRDYCGIDLHSTNSVVVVIESTYNWYWLVDALLDAGLELHLANLGRSRAKTTSRWRYILKSEYEGIDQSIEMNWLS